MTCRRWRAKQCCLLCTARVRRLNRRSPAMVGSRWFPGAHMADVFIAAATRTPFGRYGGRLAAVRCDDLAAAPIISLISRYPSVDWGAVDEVILGCANQAGEDNRNVARMAVLLSGLTETADNLAREHRIDRASQDAYALRSQRRTAQTQAKGWLAEEITPVQVPNERIAVSEDEHPRPKITLEQLAQLKPLLGTDSTITAGNASGINDGACALLLASAAALNTHGLQPLARVISVAAVGVAPRIMGIGPVSAIHKLLAKIGRRLDQFDRIEINEAFAAHVLACTRSLGLADDAEHVTGNGGAIALGHPLGASGARLVMTAVYALRRQQQARALVSLCVGVGQGVALALERA